MSHPNFAALLAREPAVAPAFIQTVERELEYLTSLRADVERSDAAAVDLSSDAHFAVRAIEKLGTPTADECVALFAVLFRVLERQSHVTRNRDAMACLAGMVADFTEAHEPRDYRDDPKERDEAQFERYCAAHPDYLEKAL
jgi:hypothetical protein